MFHVESIKNQENNLNSDRKYHVLTILQDIIDFVAVKFLNMSKICKSVTLQEGHDVWLM